MLVQARSRWNWLYWFIITIVGIFLSIWTCRDIMQLTSMQKMQTNPVSKLALCFSKFHLNCTQVYICNELNSWMLPHFYTHFGLCALLLFTGSFFGNHESIDIHRFQRSLTCVQVSS